MLGTLLAVAAAVGASVTGILAVGCGRRFRYAPVDLVNGDPKALAYTWTSCSTVASAFHAAAMLDAAVRGGGHVSALVLSASIVGSLLFAAAHLAVGRWADRLNGAPA